MNDGRGMEKSDLSQIQGNYNEHLSSGLTIILNEFPRTYVPFISCLLL